MPNLPVLFRMQEIESRLAVLLKKRQQLEQHADLVLLRQRLKEFTAHQEHLGRDGQQVKLKQSQLDLELKTLQEHLKIEEQKLYGGAITSSRELEQIQSKVSEYAKKRVILEDEILKLMEQDEQVTHDLQELKQVIVGVEVGITDVKQQIGQEMIEITMEEQDLSDEAALLIVKIPEDWLSRYRRIAGSHHGVAIARVKNNSCGACHVSLSDMMLQQVKRGEDCFYYCENCARILYY